MKRILPRLGLTLFVLGGIALLVAIYHYDLLPLEKAVCRADNSALELPIDDYVEGYIGGSILEFPAAKYLDSIIDRYPQIERASISRKPKGQLTFDYSLKRPIIFIHLDKIYGLTARGELVPADGSNHPIITGLKIRKPQLYCQLPQEKIGYALKLAGILSRDDSGVRGMISTIDLNGDFGLSLFIEDCHLEMILGRGNEAAKFALVARLMDFFKTLDNDILAVDFRFENQLVLKKTL
jgi:hypothetical protein